MIVIAPGWHANTGETTVIWTTETVDLPLTLHDLADHLTDRPDLLLISLINGPGEPRDPASFILQAVLTQVLDMEDDS